MTEQDKSEMEGSYH